MIKSLLLSVIIPVYNVAPYLEQCLDSVIHQTYQNLEIICINDGSTDNSLEILERYKKKDKRIKVFSTENRGLSCARNLGLDNAKGELIAFVDSDDFLCLNAYEKAVNEFLKDPNLELVTFDHFNFYKKGHVIVRKYNELDGYVWKQVYRTDIISKFNIRFIPNLLYEDIYFSQAYKICCNKEKYIDEPLYYYRMRRQDSFCNSVLKDGARLLDWMKNVDELAIFARKYNLYSENEDMICRWYVCGASGCKTEEMKESVFSHVDKCVLKSNCSQEIKDEYLRVKNPTLIDRLKKVGFKIIRSTISFLLDLMA